MATISQNILGKLNARDRAEVEKLLKMPVIPDVLRYAFPLQRDFILDDSKLKTLFCTRRSAKSYTGGMYLVREALRVKGSSNVYIALTRDSAKRIIWDDVLKNIIGRLGVSVKYNETELSITFPNGSNIFCVGVNDSEAEKEKLLGKKFALAVIDEAASFDIDLHALVFKVLKPALSDYRGTLCLLGTPSDRKSGLFYKLTCDVETIPPQKITRDGWKVWTWTAYDNPHMAAQWDETIRELKMNDPHVEEQPWYQQMYLARWVALDSNKIYKYNTERNAWTEKLPDYGWHPWQMVLGIDLGFADSSALALLAWHPHDRNTHVIRAEKRKGLTLTELAAWIREWMAQYPINNFIVDGANLQAVEEMRRHQGLPLEAAQKSDKLAYIRILNSALVSGNIKIHTASCEQLLEEFELSLWDSRSLERGVYKESYAYHPDIADAMLYAYRYTYSYTSTPRPHEDEERNRLIDGLDDDARRTMERFRQEQEEEALDRWGSEYLYER